ncbi:MAG: class I SAM-dependent methyltransferase [Gammaproteobacteria bacterium]|nr:class I SAM-dependent methyltransferase [Gammaproteobacteria bacterium]
MDISKLKAGDHHYMAYVGPPAQYDVMGATQFRLLCTLGLRANHYVLDFGCGSLRAGRLFITYLDEGRYFGIEPNEWLIKDAIDNQVGNDLIRLKKPQFDHNSDFATDVFSQQFDFIIAQSVFSHAGSDIIRIALRRFKDSLKLDGIIAVNFREGNSDFNGNGWVYPACVDYLPSTIKQFAKDADLFFVRIPWYHRRQTWYLFSKDRQRLPSKAMLRYLTGAVLFDPAFVESWKRSPNIIKGVETYIKRILSKLLKRGGDIQYRD